MSTNITLDTKLADISFSMRRSPVNALNKAGFYTVRDIQDNIENLVRSPGIGVNIVMEVVTNPQIVNIIDTSCLKKINPTKRIKQKVVPYINIDKTCSKCSKELENDVPDTSENEIVTDVYLRKSDDNYIIEKRNCDTETMTISLTPAEVEMLMVLINNSINNVPHTSSIRKGILDKLNEISNVNNIQNTILESSLLPNENDVEHRRILNWVDDNTYRKGYEIRDAIADFKNNGNIDDDIDDFHAAYIAGITGYRINMQLDYKLMTVNSKLSNTKIIPIKMRTE